MRPVEKPRPHNTGLLGSKGEQVTAGMHVNADYVIAGPSL